jgi:glycosyltransferase involved in cell wall biosynthesis
MNSCTVAYAFYETDFRVSRYAEALAGPGVVTDAIALRAEGKAKTEVINGVRLYRIQKRRFDEQGGPFDYLYKMGTFFIKASFLILINHLRHPYRLIIVHNVPDFFVFTALVPRLLGAKVILDIHDILPEFFCQRFGKPLDSIYGRLLRAAEFLSVRFASFVITGNDLWREKVSKRNGVPFERTIGMVNYPHLEYFRGIEYAPRSDRLSVIYPGHLSHHHGIDIAVRAMPAVRKRVPFATLDIYAASWIPQYRYQLERMMEDLNLSSFVKIHPPRNIHELVEAYKVSDIGVVPKRGGIFAAEAFSSKILDFMASGIPIVASRTAIDEFYFDDSQIMFFKPDDAEDLARAILELHGDPARKRVLSENGKQYAAENNWGTKRPVFLDIVHSLGRKDSSWPAHSDTSSSPRSATRSATLKKPSNRLSPSGSARSDT